MYASLTASSKKDIFQSFPGLSAEGNCLRNAIMHIESNYGQMITDKKPNYPTKLCKQELLIEARTRNEEELSYNSDEDEDDDVRDEVSLVPITIPEEDTMWVEIICSFSIIYTCDLFEVIDSLPNLVMNNNLLSRCNRGKFPKIGTILPTLIFLPPEIFFIWEQHHLATPQIKRIVLHEDPAKCEGMQPSLLNKIYTGEIKQVVICGKKFNYENLFSEGVFFGRIFGKYAPYDAYFQYFPSNIAWGNELDINSIICLQSNKTIPTVKKYTVSYGMSDKKVTNIYKNSFYDVEKFLDAVSCYFQQKISAYQSIYQAAKVLADYQNVYPLTNPQKLLDSMAKLENKIKNMKKIRFSLKAKTCSICANTMTEHVMMPCCVNFFCYSCTNKFRKSNCPACREKCDYKTEELLTYLPTPVKFSEMTDKQAITALLNILVANKQNNVVVVLDTESAKHSMFGKSHPLMSNQNLHVVTTRSFSLAVLLPTATHLVYYHHSAKSDSSSHSGKISLPLEILRDCQQEEIKVIRVIQDTLICEGAILIETIHQIP